MGEYRLVRKDERRSIIELARVDGLEEFYARLEAALGAPHGGLIRPPAHVTLFTSCDPAGRGIGIATQDELAAWTEPLPPLAASPWKLGQDGAILGP